MPKSKKAKGKDVVAVTEEIHSASLPSDTTPERQAFVACAENIALLYFLHPVPHRHLHNERPPPTARDAAYSMPFEKERALCGSFAFIASIQDDPNHIPAVCLEEDPKRGALKILIAVNEGKAGDGKQFLEEIRTGFDAILEILGCVRNGTGSNLGIESELLGVIVGMCSQRIEVRLRYKKKSFREKKPPFKDTLQRVIDYFRLNQPPDHLHQSVAKFDTRVRRTRDLLTEWEGHRVTESLQHVVESMHELSQTPDLKEVVDLLQTELSSRTSILNIILKVGRYREVARQLYRAAKRFPIVRNAEVIPITLGSDAFVRFTSSLYTPDIRSALDSKPIRKDHKKLDQICRHLSHNSDTVTEADAEIFFAEKARRTMKEGKIHAEIQLVYHYLDNSPQLPSRVVCSSKDACYLCNAFITMHKTFHASTALYTPRSHGKLYPGWRLPSTRPNQTKRFNLVLVERLRESLAELFRNQERTTYVDPTESTLLTLIASNTTLASAPRSETRTNPPKDERSEVDEPVGVPTLNVIAEAIVPEPPLSEVHKSQVPSIQGDCLMDGIQERDWAAEARAPGKPSSVSQLSIGEIESQSSDKPEHFVSGRLASGETSSLYMEDLLGIQVENVVGSGSYDDSKPPLAFRIRWLADKEAQLARENSSLGIVEARTIDGEVSYSLTNRSRTIYISHADQIAQIRLSRRRLQKT